jgi:hypothetical protein
MKSTDKRVAPPPARSIGPVVAALLLAFVAAPAAAGERLNASQIEATFAGATLDGTYFNGAYFTEAYHDDGTIRYWDAISADSGEWSVQDGQFCTFYEGQEGACFTVERDGTNCFTFFEKDPGTGAIDPKKWTSRGWIRGHDNTCPDVPEVRL